MLLITLIITCIYYKDLTNLVTLNTLKVLKILTDLNAEIADAPLPKINNSTKLKETIIQSNTHILSFKYSTIPYPNIFRPISTVNIIVKAKLKWFKIFDPLLSTIPSIANIIVFPKTESMMKASNHLPRAKSLTYLLKARNIP